MIDYTDYLDGFLWPSESRTDAANWADGVQTIEVQSMPPPHAASALHKLVRWAESGFLTEAQAIEGVLEVRRTTLGRALAARATSTEDFVFDEDLVAKPGQRLSTRGLARVLAISLLESAHEEDVNLDRVGVIASAVANDLENRDLKIYQGD